MPAILKTVPATVRALPAGELTNSDPLGTFEAIVSVFGNEDHHGDIVEAGAFADSINEWAASGDPLPVMWSHQYGNIDSILGHYVEAEETDVGLKLKGVLDLEHPTAQRAYNLMRRRLIKEFSWSGEVLEYEVIEPEDPDDFWAWMFAGVKILKVDLWEAGPCFKGANPETQLLGIKAEDFTGKLRARLTREMKGIGDEQLATLQKLAAGRAKADAGEHPETTVKPTEADDTPADDTVDDTQDVQPSSAATKARARLELATITTH